MPASRPPQNAESASEASANFISVVKAITMPPPAALPTMARYSAALRVM